MPKEIKTSLITGGAGFIGSELVRQVLKDGEKVVVYDNFSFGRRSNLQNDNELDIIEGDLRDYKKIRDVIEKYSPNKIFHLAAIHYIPYCIEHPQETIGVNVEGTFNVLEACKKSSVKFVGYASTAAVYPVKDKPHSENDSTGPIEIYGASKLFGEELLKIFQRDTGIKCAAARLFNGYGRRETNPHVIPDMLDQLPKGNKIKLGNIEPRRDFIHTSDISRAFRMMADNGEYAYERFNVGTGAQISVKELVDIISEILDRPITIATQKSRMRKIERMHLVPDISKIKSMIGWQPVMSLKDGFVDMLKSVSLL